MSISAATTLVIGFQNCAPSKYNYASAEEASLDKTCSESTVQSEASQVKVLFLMDLSGSNLTTDANKVWRTQALDSVLSKYGNSSHFFFGFVNFMNSSATSLIQSGSSPIFSNQLPEINSAMVSFQNTADSGGTPYRKAISKAYEMISADIQSSRSTDILYSVIFISDGQPSDYSNISQIETDAKALVDLAPDRVILNSIFYYNSSRSSYSSDETKYLNAFAKAGQGKLAVANTNESVNVNSLINVTKTICK